MGMMHDPPGTREEDKWQDVWQEYGLDIGASVEGLEECAITLQDNTDKSSTLAIYETFFAARSAADAFSPLAGFRMNEVCTHSPVGDTRRWLIVITAQIGFLSS